MRKLFLAALAAATLTFGGAAFAQSQQGGYLGQNPGGHQTASAAAPTHIESHQGGYLGRNAGADLKPAHVNDDEMKTSPTAWCRAASVEPGRCSGRAQADHDYCMSKGTDHEGYKSCRRAMDFIGWHN
jgi:hypothetical protein